VPTDAGRALLAQARVVLREAALLADLRDAQAGVVAGTLRVGALPTLAPYLLPRFLPGLATAHPQLRLVVDELPTERLLDALRADALDVGLIATAPDTPGLSQRALLREPLVAYAHSGHPLAAQAAVRPEHLTGSDLWLLSEEHCLREQTVRLCRDRESADGRPTCATAVRFESGNVETLRRLVEGGDGFTLLPLLAVPERAPVTARVVPFEEPAPYREIRLVQRRLDVKRALVDAFVAALLASVDADLRVPSAEPA
jgi:LysR family hydrogen peroxide-inducible transcriptional activator